MTIVNVIGVDGSLRNFGMAVASLNLDTNSFDVITLILSETEKDNTKGVKRSHDDLARFGQHWDKINEAITEYDVKIAFGEVPSGAQDARAAFAFGGITAILSALPVPLVPLSPLEVKEGSTGRKHADKEDIMEWAYGQYPYVNWVKGNKPNKMDIRTEDGKYLTLKNEHTADSIAAIAAGVKSKEFIKIKSSL